MKYLTNTPLSKTFYLLILVLAAACEKTEPGCTDQYAANYSETAIEDNGSCLYSDINLVFWLNEDRANYYMSSGAIFPMRVVVDGVEIGVLNADVTYDENPGCSVEEGVVNYALEMLEKERWVELKFVDNTETAFYTTSRLFSAAGGTCRNILF